MPTKTLITGMTLDKRTFLVTEIALYAIELGYSREQFQRVLKRMSKEFNFTMPTTKEQIELRDWILWFGDKVKIRYKELFGEDIPSP